MTAPMHRQATAALIKATGQRWCGQHQGYADAEGGMFKQAGRAKRWVCARCAERLKGVKK